MLKTIEKSDWSPVHAAHLLNRAGFGATPTTIAAAVKRDPIEVVRELVHYEDQVEDSSKPAWVLAPDAADRPDRRALQQLSEEERKKAQDEMRRKEQRQLLELRGWWLNRMRNTRRPLEEKLTLFWHSHFATSFEKVKEGYALYAQNQMFREHAAGNWEALVTAVARDPAMLIYLDNARSKKDHPNENFARELMELFTLGEGNYTEDDIKESARAFTGWGLQPDRFEFQFNPRQHDGGEKTFMGAQGNLDGGDIIAEIIHHPNAAHFITAKLWRYFAYPDPEPAVIEELAGLFQKNQYELKPLLEAMFTCKAFYSERALRTQIKSPVQWLVGTSILLDADLPAPEVCMLSMRSMGQELFAPPNVKGWDGGYTWITTSTMMYRYNFAGFMVKGADRMLPEFDRKKHARPMNEERMQNPMAMAQRKMGVMRALGNTEEILPKEYRGSLEKTQRYLEWRLYQSSIRASDASAVRLYLTKMRPPTTWEDEDIRNVLHVMMSTPYYQLC